MKHNVKLFGIIIAVVIMSLVPSGCSNGSTNPAIPETSGSLTITGLATFNGKYVFAIKGGTGGMDEILACSSISSFDVNKSEVICIGGQVTGGSVTLKAWKILNMTLQPYSGNDSVTIDVFIQDASVFDVTSLSGGGNGHCDVTFVNGVGSDIFY